MDSRKIIYLILLATAIGLFMVHLQTVHIQAVNKMILLQEEQKRLEKEIAQLEIRVNSQITSPQQLREKIEKLKLDMIPVIEAGQNNQDDEEE